MSETKGMGGHSKAHEGATGDWLTPPWLIGELGPFDLDPCASENQPWATASHHITEANNNGLTQTWWGRVWCNPPYGLQTWHWLEKLADHGDGMALIFARTETVGFVEQVWSKASGLLFVEGRLYFHHPVTGEQASGNAGAPSVLVAYGKDAQLHLFNSNIRGSRVSGWYPNPNESRGRG